MLTAVVWSVHTAAFLITGYAGTPRRAKHLLHRPLHGTPQFTEGRPRMPAESLQDVYLDELKDAFSAEQQILAALPKMEKAAAHTELRDAFREHRELTDEHVRRLELIMESLNQTPKGKKCKGMAGIIAEGEDVLKETNGNARDAALISAAQRVEHYEIAMYGSLRTFANELGRTQDAALLQQTLDEEGEADKTLSKIAESAVNLDAIV
ncbi:MAG: ferritin-like domain-containing protein [Longimicrobiales bacterium]